MSLILDALRKMEQERKARQSGTVDIRPAVLSRGVNNEPTPRNLSVLVIAGVVLLLAGIGAGLLIRDDKSPHPLQQPTDQAAMVTDGKPVTTMPPPPPAAPPVEPVRAPPAAAVPTAVPAPQRPVVAEDNQATSAEPADRGIAISGIAWQDERGLRRAVVNGSLVGEGAEVAGARIIEIKERSVRFSRGGKSFEVSYSSAFPSR